MSGVESMRVKAELNLNEAIAAFPIEGELVGALRYGDGHINDTFCVYTQLDSGDVKRYILQRLSSVAFKEPDQLMQNISKVTSFLQEKIKTAGGDARKEAMNLIRTKSGQFYFTDSNFENWRLYDFIEGTYYLSKVENAEQFYESARTFGKFQALLADFPAAELYETIKNFHNTVDRLNKLKKSVEADKMNRVKEVADELGFVEKRVADCRVLVDQLNNGTLPLKVTHNDTKLNNILFDKNSDKGICVIDLDTVMPGLCAYDFGDSIRFGANTAAEDEQDLSKVKFDLNLFEVYTKGYAESSKETLSEAEIKSLPWGAKLMTLECGIRFLTDYLDGDVYFSVKKDRPKHNLDRCRTQLKLVREMENVWEQMLEIVENCFA